MDRPMLTWLLLLKVAAFSIFANASNTVKQNAGQLRFMIDCARNNSLYRGLLPEGQLDFDGYGCTCGIGSDNGKEYEPVDDIDACCKVHNYCYKSLMKACIGHENPINVAYFWDKSNCDKGIIECQDNISLTTRCDRLACECDKAIALCFVKYNYNDKYSPSKMNKKKMCNLAESSTPVLEIFDCNKYGDIMSLTPQGAQRNTAMENNLHIIGVTASEKLVYSDLNELMKFKNMFYEVGRSHGIHPALIAGIASRVSRVGSKLKPNGFHVENLDGYGMLQCNDKTSGLECQKYKPLSKEHVNMIVAESLIPIIKKIQNKFPNWAKEHQLQGGVAAYNCGLEDVQNWKRLDNATDNSDFSNDIIARAHALHRKHQWYCQAETRITTFAKSSNAIQFPNYNTDCETLLKNGDCNFYYFCVEKVIGLIEDISQLTNFHMGFAYNLCIRLYERKEYFLDKGRVWIDESTKCLMNSINDAVKDPKITSRKIKAKALAKLTDCFTESGDGFFSMISENKEQFFKVMQFSDFYVDSSKYIHQKMLEIFRKINYLSSSCESIVGIGKEFTTGVKSKISKYLSKTFPQITSENIYTDYIKKWVSESNINIEVAQNPVTNYITKQCKSIIKSLSGRKKRSFKDDIIAFSRDWTSAVASYSRKIVVQQIKEYDASCINYAYNGDCRFFECFEERFRCSDKFVNHILHFELPNCRKMESQSKHDANVKDWFTSTQKCLMKLLIDMYSSNEIDCNLIEQILSDNRTMCMEKSGMCQFGKKHFWYIQKSLNPFGYPSILPNEFLTLPLSGRSIKLDEYYFSYLASLKRQIGDVNFGCFSKGDKVLPQFYQNIQSKVGDVMSIVKLVLDI